MIPGDAIRMSRFSAESIDLVTVRGKRKPRAVLSYKAKPGSRFVFMVLGMETEDTTIEPNKVLVAMGWKFEGEDGAA